MMSSCYPETGSCNQTCTRFCISESQHSCGVYPVYPVYPVNRIGGVFIQSLRDWGFKISKFVVPGNPVTERAFLKKNYLYEKILKTVSGVYTLYLKIGLHRVHRVHLNVYAGSGNRQPGTSRLHLGVQAIFFCEPRW